MGESNEGARLLRQCIDANGWTQRHVAHAVGVSHVTVLYWLRGWKVPRDENRERVRALTKGRVPVGAWDQVAKMRRTKVRASEVGA